ncbi:ATP-binding cassette domain-containing protein [Altererythrobacter salegens]|uniref:ATP-binding cassette domain-containing protein n=1 Tax=Croceibacterium salegens TaxID=1737568 RepID=A0A6I4SWR2_9SPHN|nr:ABC transporter ATP-binding protein [Croceibacterium salegens]MXO59246.1 ATP-binding cassette domain-containing protein [Croceibacterium salegens]
MLAAHELQLAGRLDGVSAVLKAGTITAICGPNGAGKSSLQEALAGLLRTEHGAVRLDDQPLSALPPRERARRIGYLPQAGEVAWDLSVRGLAALGRLPHGDEAAGPVDAALASLDLVDLADRPISTLSGGEKARALLARVLAGEPRWILADEPLAALDIGHQLSLLGNLRAAAEGGTGVVIVVHDLALAMNHADRVLVLGEGRLVADGPPAEALSEAVIEQVWQVPMRWIGGPGARALVSRATQTA